MKKFKSYCEGLQFHELTEDFLRGYLIYMKKTLGNADATAQRNLATIKIYVSAAIKKGYMDHNPFAEFSIKRIKSDIDFLTEDELMQFVALYYEKVLTERLQRTLAMIEQISADQLAEAVAESSGFNVGDIVGIVKQISIEMAHQMGRDVQ